MKGSILAIVAVAASFTSAQFVGVPACAQACISSAAVSAGCGVGDVGCQCSSTSQIAAFGTPCILGACTAPGELQSAIQGGGALCVAYLATVSASATGPASSSSDSLTTTLRSTVTSTATSTVAAQTTTIAVPSGVPTGFSNSTISGTPSVTRGPSGTSSRASTAASTSTTKAAGAGVKLGAGLGGVGALFVAFFAL